MNNVDGKYLALPLSLFRALYFSYLSQNTAVRVSFQFGLSNARS